jgi:hypothetical protein
VDGQLTPSTTVPPYNETVEVAATLRTTLSVQRFPYSMQPHTTDVGTLAIRTKVTAARIYKVVMPPPPTITISAYAPQIGASHDVSMPYVIIITLSVFTPSVSTV